VESGIPMAAGLGSSAATTVAGLRLFERWRTALDRELLAAAIARRGHADNAAPALLGGLTSVVADEGHAPEALHWTWPDELRLVVATPSMGLATVKARAAPDHMHRRDAIFNMQRCSRWCTRSKPRTTSGFARVSRSLASAGALDPRAAALRRALTLGSRRARAFLSGAGPSIAVIAQHNFERLEQLLSTMYSRAGLQATVRTLTVHHAPAAERTGASVSGR
jgi:homoserine kinase